MAKIDVEYHKLLKTILKEGFIYEDPNRKGINRIQIPTYQFKHDFKEGFPALTTKKVYWKGAVGELLTFLSGSTELKDLHKNSVKFWDADAYNFYLKETGFEKNKESLKSFQKGITKPNHKAGDLGKIYPYQMRRWESIISNSWGYYVSSSIDQIKDLIHTLKTDPMATKKTVTMWNPSNLKDSCLSPCHWSFEILTSPLSLNERLDLISLDTLSSKIPCEKEMDDMGIAKYKFNLKWHQHSVDTFLGLPINIIYYSLMSYIIGKLSNMIPLGIIGDLSNVHIYEPHLDAVKEQLSRDVDKYIACDLEDFKGFELYMNGDIDQWLSSKSIEDFKLNGYNSYHAIKADMFSYSK